jgi:hypothetical protein
MLCGGGLGNLVRMVTGLAVGLNVTLTLAALDLVRPQAAAVEALIGMSIALVAVENVWLLPRNQRQLPMAVCTTAACLGLTASFGFGRVTWLCWAGLLLFLVCRHLLQEQSSNPVGSRWGVALLFGADPWLRLCLRARRDRVARLWRRRRGAHAVVSYDFKVVQTGTDL